MSKFIQTPYRKLFTGILLEILCNGAHRLSVNDILVGVGVSISSRTLRRHDIGRDVLLALRKRRLWLFNRCTSNLKHTGPLLLLIARIQQHLDAS